MRRGLGAQMRGAGTGLAAERSSRYPAARYAIPVMIIRAQMVSHGLLPPTSAATRCVQVATGPYTEGAFCHRGSTRATYGLWTPPGRRMGQKVYGSCPSAAMRP